MPYRRVTLLILDGLGCGQAPDAAFYGDDGSDTLRHVAEAAAAAGRPLSCPVLASLGLGRIYDGGLPGFSDSETPRAHYGRLTEVSAGKDSTTGHWELCGLPRLIAAPTFLDGFPPQLIAAFSQRCGRGVLGNTVASGTTIIQELGQQQLESGKLIVYTSADSVFQIAAHVDSVPLDELYRCCHIAREMLTGAMAVDRVIARPFTGSAAAGFVRTPDRKDFSIVPPGPTLLDELQEEGLDVIGVGKIGDLFAYTDTGRGLSLSYPFHTNAEQLLQTGEVLRDKGWSGLLFTNLVDFDQLYGHRNNADGFARALETFDRWLAGALELLGDDDLLFITADHGNDPTTDSTDHSREQVPLLAYSRAIAAAGGQRLEAPVGFMHVAASIAAALGIKSSLPGVPLLSDYET